MGWFYARGFVENPVEIMGDGLGEVSCHGFSAWGMGVYGWTYLTCSPRIDVKRGLVFAVILLDPIYICLFYRYSQFFHP